MSYFGTKEWFVQAGLGLIPGVSVSHKYGHSASVGTSARAVAVGNSYQMPTTVNASLVVYSTDANDTGGGSGANTITIEGLGTGFAYQTETVSLGGTTSVALSNSWLRIYRAYVDQTGTYANASAQGSHQGEIRIRETGGGNTWAIIDTTDTDVGQTQIACYTVPAGRKAIVTDVHIFVDTGKDADVHFYQRGNALDVSVAPFTGGARRLVSDVHGLTGVVDLNPHVPYGPFPEGTDLFFSAETSVGTSEVTVDFTVVLVSS